MKTLPTKQNTPEYMKAELYAALKLIEQLYMDGYIQKHIYQNICKEYRKECA